MSNKLAHIQYEPTHNAINKRFTCIPIISTHLSQDFLRQYTLKVMSKYAFPFALFLLMEVQVHQAFSKFSINKFFCPTTCVIRSIFCTHSEPTKDKKKMRTIQRGIKPTRTSYGKMQKKTFTGSHLVKTGSKTVEMFSTSALLHSQCMILQR